jgi:peptidoglycan/LPS O-acetylase OafA/YrhL
MAAIERVDVTASPRLGFLDGLRGIAALQVVALHYAQAFFPAIGLLDKGLMQESWEIYFINSPLFFLFDGYLSVYVFFLISGCALTYAFGAQPFALLAGLMRRVVRLGLPMAAAVIFAFAVLSLIPKAHIEAGLLSGSAGWLAVVGPPTLDLSTVAREILLGGLFAGHAGETLLPGNWASLLHLPPPSQSINAPLWTLHLEFFGSVLVMLLVAVRAAWGRKIHLALCLLILPFIGIKPLALFVIGHLVAPLPLSPRWRALTRHVGVRLAALLALAAGIATSAHGLSGLPSLLQWLHRSAHLPRIDPFHAHGLIGAVTIFFGLLAIPRSYRILSARPLRWLGRISFSLYLTHFPILFTVTSAVYVAASGGTGAAVLATAAGIALSIGIAIAFERWIDRNAIRLSRLIAAVGPESRPYQPHAVVETGGEGASIGRP